MTAAKQTHNKSYLEELASRLLKYRLHWLPWLMIRKQGDAIECFKLNETGWQAIEPDTIPEPTPLTKIVLLLPDCETGFRCRTFSADLVSRQDLDEAISLDVESWSPYGAMSEWLSYVEKYGNQWRAAIWVWDKRVQEDFQRQLPDKISCTHVLPELAWQVARIGGSSLSVLLARSNQRLAYVQVSEQGVPLQVDWPSGESEAKRFWRSLGADGEQVEVCYDSEDALGANPWLPQGVATSKIVAPLGKLKFLRQAQQQGVFDWLNPSNWIKPVTVVAGLLVVLALADAAVLHHKSNEVDGVLDQVSSSAREVLGIQQNVEANFALLSRFAELREKQSRPEYLLAKMSAGIPDDIWLEIVQLDGRWLDIRGKGKDVVRLLALLEGIKGVEDVVLLNDIRPDPQTGMEQFQIRVVIEESANRLNEEQQG